MPALNEGGITVTSEKNCVKIGHIVVLKSR